MKKARITKFLLVFLLLCLVYHPRETLGKADRKPNTTAGYAWTTDHMHVGVRWQPFPGRPENNAYDATRPIITEDSSYVQFWVSWPAVEPMPAHTNYAEKTTAYMQSIEAAVNTCHAEGVKVEFVFYHVPGWASVSGETGGWKPRPDHYAAFVTRIAKHFKGRVHGYQLAHEANLEGFMKDGDIDDLISEILIKGARAVRNVYEAAPAEPVVVSPTGYSPCHTCPTLPSLDAVGGKAVNRFYDHLVGSAELMDLVDALNINVSDHLDGYGGIDRRYITSTWAGYDLVRRKLDDNGYRGKRILAAESWISWDDGMYGKDTNRDRKKNEQDAYLRTLTIMGECLERGLNTMNFPWSDNSSDWAMGLTKRRDYNGRVKELNPDIVVPANDGGPDIVTQKVALHGGDANFKIAEAPGNIFTVEDYINPADPNHLHYYIWKWFAQISGGSDEVIRHALAGEMGNDITVTGRGFKGKETYRIASYNRTRDRFLVLLYAGDADGSSPVTVSVPSRIQNGRYYNNEHSRLDFRGVGFANGEIYHARILTKDISQQDGSDVSPVTTMTANFTVADEALEVTVPALNKFTAVMFIQGANSKHR